MESAEASGDVREERLRRWIAEYSEAILRACRLLLSDRGQAEDAMQDTFLKAWRHMADYEKKHVENDKAWLLRIAANTCRDYRRSAWFRRVDRRADWADLSPDPSGAFEGDSLSAVLNTPVRPSPGAGKLITGSSWQLAAFVRPEDAARLSPGTELELLLPEGSYPARAAALQIRADGQATAVIVCSRGMTAVADKRVLSARAVLGRTEGLLLPAAAVRRDEEGDYVLRQAGRFVRRESVTVLARREGQALVRSDALREGSEVLLPAS